MAVNQKTNNKAYGLNNPLQSLSPEPIVSKRNPNAADKAEFGTVWVNTVTAGAFILASKGVWVEVESSGGSGDFSALTVSGASSLNTVSASGNTVLTTLTTSGAATLNSITGTSVAQSASFSAVNNALIGTVRFTGNTIANAATQTFTITNSNVTDTSSVLASISNNNVSSNGAGLTVTSQLVGTGSFVIDVTCVGGVSGLGATDTVIVSYMILG